MRFLYFCPPRPGLGAIVRWIARKVYCFHYTGPQDGKGPREGGGGGDSLMFRRFLFLNSCLTERSPVRCNFGNTLTLLKTLLRTETNFISN